MATTSAAITIAGDDQGAPRLSPAQRALFRFGFAYDAASGSYYLVDGTSPVAQQYLHADPGTGALVIDVSQDGSTRLVRLSDGSITA